MFLCDVEADQQHGNSLDRSDRMAEVVAEDIVEDLRLLGQRFVLEEHVHRDLPLLLLRMNLLQSDYLERPPVERPLEERAGVLTHRDCRHHDEDKHIQFDEKDVEKNLE